MSAHAAPILIAASSSSAGARLESSWQSNRGEHVYRSHRSTSRKVREVQRTQGFDEVAGLVVDDLCAVDFFAFFFSVLVWVAAGFETAVFD
jgi:hypothetical protein